MTVEERAALLKLRDSLAGVLAMGAGEKRKGHVPGCQRGYWLRRDHPEGEPCSERCAEAQAAIETASRLLDASAVRQGAFA